MYVTDFVLAPNCRTTKLEFNRTQLLTYLNQRDTICGGGACSDGIMTNTSTNCWTDGYSVNDAGTILSAQTFNTPTVDAAPWYDSNFPESAHFFGFYLQDVTGLDSTFGRDVKPRTVGQNGGSLGPLRAKQRLMKFRLLAFGCDDTALDYAMRWLIDMLTGQCDACDGCNAWVRFSCPDSTTETPLGGGETLLSRWKQNRWEMKSVALIDGPVWGTPPIEDMSCRVRTVEFTLAAADPYFYKDEVSCTPATLWVPSGTPTCLDICTWLDTIVGHSYQVCCLVNSSQNIGETIINLTVSTGSSGLAELDFVGRTVVGLDCAVPGTTFYTLKLQNLPANSTIVVDTAAQQITSTTGGVTRDAFDLVNVDSSQTFGFPTLRDSQACFCAVVSACSVASDATAAITTQYRLL